MPLKIIFQIKIIILNAQNLFLYVLTSWTLTEFENDMSFSKMTHTCCFELTFSYYVHSFSYVLYEFEDAYFSSLISLKPFEIWYFKIKSHPRIQKVGVTMLHKQSWCYNAIFIDRKLHSAEVDEFIYHKLLVHRALVCQQK